MPTSNKTQPGVFCCDTPRPNTKLPAIECALTASTVLTVYSAADDAASNDSDSSSMPDPFGLAELVASARTVVSDCERVRLKTICLREQAARCVHRLTTLKAHAVLPPIGLVPQSPTALAPLAPPTVPPKKRHRRRRRTEADIAKLVAFKQRCAYQKPAKLTRKFSFHAVRQLTRLALTREHMFYNRYTHNTEKAGVVDWQTWTRTAGKLKELVSRWKVRAVAHVWLQPLKVNNAGHAARLQMEIKWSQELEAKRAGAGAA